MSWVKDWRAWPAARQGIGIVEALVGPRPARRRQAIACRQPRSFLTQRPFIEDRAVLDRHSSEVPVFILSAGWRSGSTMLQRMLMGGNDVLIWGEPFDHCDILGTMKRQWLAFTNDWPAPGFFFDGSLNGISERWVANLYPSVQDMYDAHVAFFVRFFAEPARRHDCSRWGIKEVRWSVDDAAFLHWLFPRARFLFLYRDPLSAWRSYRTSRSWYLRWPAEPVFTPYRFGRYWGQLAGDYQEQAHLVGGMVLRYEELLATDDVSALQDYLELPVQRPGDLSRIRSRKKEAGPERVPALERWLLKRGLAGTAEQLGYRF